MTLDLEDIVYGSKVPVAIAEYEALRDEIVRLKGCQPYVWADEATPFTGEEVRELLKHNEALRAEKERLERVAKISRQILFVVSHTRPSAVCEHGNSATYPTHGWWCDKCFGELEAALESLEVK